MEDSASVVETVVVDIEHRQHVNAVAFGSWNEDNLGSLVLGNCHYSLELALVKVNSIQNFHQEGVQLAIESALDEVVLGGQLGMEKVNATKIVTVQAVGHSVKTSLVHQLVKTVFW